MASLLARLLRHPKENQKSKELIEHLDNTVTRQLNDVDLSRAYVCLNAFIPEFTTVILGRLLNQMVHIMSRPVADPLLMPAVVDLIDKMIDLHDEDVASTNPFPQLEEQPNFPPALFGLMDLRFPASIRIANALFVRCPIIVTDFAAKSWRCLLPLLKDVCETGNAEAAQLLHRVVASRQEVLGGMMPHLKKSIKALPLSTAIDFMYAAPGLRDAITDHEAWLSNFSKLTISDAEAITIMFPSIWQSPSMIKILLNVAPFETVRDVQWISRTGPIECEIDATDIERMCRELVQPNVFASVVRGYGRNRTVKGSVAGLAYLRLFMLSMVDYSQIRDDVRNNVIDLIGDPNEWVSSAAAQAVLLWITQGWMPDYGLAYRASAAVVEDDRTPAYACLGRVLLRSLYNSPHKEVSILMGSERMQCDAKTRRIVSTAPWHFPHISRALDKLADAIVDEADAALHALGCLIDMIDGK